MKKYPGSYDWRFGIYNRHSDWLHLRYFPGYYRVSHIKLDRVNGSKLRFEGQIGKLKKNESF